MVKKILIALFVLNFGLGFAHAQSLKLVTYDIPMLVVNENEGVFIELAKETAKRAGVDIIIEIRPIQRAIKTFMDGNADILYPALTSYFPADFKVEQTEPIFQKRDFIFTMKTQPILTTIKELEGKKVGIVNAAPYSQELLGNQKIIFDRVITDDLNAKKLVKGRLDATVIEEKSALSAFNAINAMDSVHYNPDNPVTIQDAYFAFQKSNSGNAAKFSSALVQMKKDGTFGQIMSKIPQ